MKTVLDIDAGLEQKSLALWANELNNTDFIAKARAVARLICAVSGSVTVDDIRTHPAMQGVQPSSSNTYGSIFHCAGWHCIGFEPSQVKRNHARFVRRWEWRP